MTKNITIIFLLVLAGFLGWYSTALYSSNQDLSTEMGKVTEKLKKQQVVEKIVINHDSVRCTE